MWAQMWAGFRLDWRLNSVITKKSQFDVDISKFLIEIDAFSYALGFYIKKKNYLVQRLFPLQSKPRLSPV